MTSQRIARPSVETGTLDVQPYQLFPPLDDEDFLALKRDIAEHGVLVPVEYDDGGNVLDGHHRLRALAELGREGITLPPPPSIVREGLSEEEKRQHIRRLNILRRHLTQEQRRELIRDQVRETQAVSDTSIGKSLGVSPTTVGTVRREMVADGSLSNLESERHGADGRVINTSNIGRAPTPRRAPDPEMVDDYRQGLVELEPVATPGVRLRRRRYQRVFVSVGGFLKAAQEALSRDEQCELADRLTRGSKRG